MSSGWGVDRADAASGSGSVLVTDHGLLLGLTDDDHPQYLLASAATSRSAFATNWADLTDGGGTTLHTHAHSAITGSASGDDHTQYLLASDATSRSAFATNWADLTDGGGTTLHTHAHSALTGSASGDDHTQYLLLAGRSGGQVVSGSTAAGEHLTLNSTSHATKGEVRLQTGGGNVVVGGGATASELRFLEPSGSGSNYTAFKAGAQEGNVTYTLPTADAAAAGYFLQSDGAGNLAWAAAGGGGGGGSAITHAVTQASHGFSVGNVLYFTGSAYALADADAASTAHVVGIVSSVEDTSNFTLTLSGRVAGLSGLAAGTVYFLSGTAGQLTSTEPSSAGQISKPLFIATSSSQGFFFNFRGLPARSTPTIQVFTASGTWTKPAGLTAVIVELIGGGGGGAGGPGGGGGGAGGYARKRILASSLGGTETVTRGGGGGGGSAGSNGSAGSASSFGSHCSGNGGNGALASDGTTGYAGAGGSASGGDVNAAGGNGTQGSGSLSGGVGGAGFFGTTGAPGSGGQGAAVVTSGSAGTNGIVIVTEFYT